ncbi:hypothetical protein Phep_1355 [Pedobacter heparinus DSM 2366]|uniref:Uncharacterized protein n=2 Tax=Pedobacter heparinus TaxID=984 RepID=C6XT09_PEDHD|nr:hypothetical protein Phep_1355 [Pedobacter heparinus DSM 2366]
MIRHIFVVTSFLIISANLFAQQHSVPKVDFFKDQKKLLCWSGPMSSSFKSNKEISAVPLMHYFDSKKGTARIICKPNYGFDKWKTYIRKYKNIDIEYQKVREIAINESVQKNFTIYAFLMESKYLVDPTEKPYFPGEKEMEFPAPILIYKKEGKNWKQLAKVDVKDWSAFADLQMNTILGKSGYSK